MKCLPRSIRILFTLLPLPFLAPSAFSYEEIKIAVGEWPPYISQNKKHNGVVTHIIQDIFSSIGIESTIHFLPWSRAYNDTSKGDFDASAIWMHKEEREEYFIYSDKVLTEEFVFFHKNTLDFDWDSISNLRKFSIGGIYGYSYGPRIDQAIKNKTIRLALQVTTPEQNFKMLLHDRIQLFPFELNVGHSILKDQFSTQEKKEITYHPKPFLQNYSFVLFPKALKGSRNLVLRFNKRLNEIKANGEYDIYFQNLKKGVYEIEN